ncbi:hypothetical protein GCM10028796_41680 [Ramlibacter monticola]|uniref:Uncharacterized protein n=1 Tax=Ramlibacter monticola TaxID=1926872 RepID=A0A936Z0B4_9BURK|nr:hypothetical protein [Ramlibacter monticola]MBL0392768.1 hypothetical protein [Ramlibacter monticola]
MRSFACIASLFLVAEASSSWAFEQAFEPPPFVVSVPQIPDFRVTNIPNRSNALSVHALGRNEIFAAEVTAAPSPQAGSTRTCAGMFLRDLVKRPNMPDRDSIYRAPFDASTFLVLYILEQRGKKELHAHLLSSAGGTHCVDAHFSRDMAVGEDEDKWRTTFTGARIREGSK